MSVSMLNMFPTIMYKSKRKYNTDILCVINQVSSHYQKRSRFSLNCPFLSKKLHIKKILLSYHKQQLIQPYQWTLRRTFITYLLFSLWTKFIVLSHTSNNFVVSLKPFSLTKTLVSLAFPSFYSCIFSTLSFLLMRFLFVYVWYTIYVTFFA